MSHMCRRNISVKRVEFQSISLPKNQIAKSVLLYGRKKLDRSMIRLRLANSVQEDFWSGLNNCKLNQKDLIKWNRILINSTILPDSFILH